MEGFPWGGSEELWAKTALEALAKNHQVQVCVKEWSPEPIKIKTLRNNGALILKRQAHLKGFLNRVFRKLRNTQQATYLNDITIFNPDYILISQGASFDFIRNPELFNFIQAFKKPYALISQFNYETGEILFNRVSSKIRTIDHLWQKFYFVSSRNLQTAERQIACALPNTEIIDNPLNLNKVGILNWPNTEIINIACVARYDCSFKGQDILIQTLSMPVFKNVKYFLNFYGKGPDESYLRALVKYYGLQEKITINNYIEDIDSLWETHHLLALPSIAEGTPLSLQECLFKGRPALVTDVGDCTKLVTDGQNGFVAPTASVNCLKAKLIEIFATPLIRLKEMGEASFNVATTQIDLHSSLKILTNIEKNG